MSKKKLFLFLLTIILGIIVGVLKPFSNNLSIVGHHTLMMVIVTIALWIFRPFGVPMSVASGLLMASLLIIGIDSSIVFKGYSSDAVWTLIPALFYGYVLDKTGLGNRIAFFFMKSINISYINLLLIWSIIGVVLSLLTPSVTVRVVIVLPIALNCVEACRLKEGSKGRSLILITAWAMAIIPGLGWFTGSLFGPILSGFYSNISKMPEITFSIWSKINLLPTILISILMVIFAYFILKPEDEINIEKSVFNDMYKKLGKITFDEKIAMLVLIFSFILFTTNSLHKIPDPAVCLIGLFILSISGIITGNDISTGINWDLIIYMGTAIGFGNIFLETGISDWLSHIIVDIMAPITDSSWSFVFIILVVFFLIRFIDIAGLIITVSIITSIAPTLSSNYGINPFIWISLLGIPMNSFFLSYTNTFALIAESSLKDKGWRELHLTKYGFAYFMAALVSMCVVIPYWDKFGLIFTK